MAEASWDKSGKQVIARIDFAERWLNRAKRQCEDGDVSRGLLTLVLASAEMSHALRMAEPTGALRRRRVVPAIALGTAAALSFAAFASWQGAPPAPASSATAPAIITFSSRVGALLEPVQVPPVQMQILPVEQPVTPLATRRPARATPPIRVDAPADAARSVPDVPAPAAVTLPVPVPRPAAALSSLHAGTVAEAGLTDSELIDLVLAAERILRIPSRP